MHVPASLPTPDQDALELSAELSRRICAEIERAGGRIPFRRFMELALYTPGLGYYMNGLRKFGNAGDFVTAPEISPLFARCVAQQCAAILRECSEPVLLEAGAGTGVLAADLLLELQQLDTLPQRYFILELSGELRRRQAETLRTRVPQLIERVTWLDRLPQTPFNGAIVANELLDAMPVHRIRIEQNGVAELHVTWHDNRFNWIAGPCSDAELAQRARELPAGLPPGYMTEIGLDAERWLYTVAPLLKRGALLLIDYGFPAHEYFHPQRTDGTLMCHFRHRAHTDALLYPGLQDITAHVNFSALAHAGHAAGLHVAGFTTQACFLIGLGIERALQSASGDRERWQLSQQIQRLTSPSEMGELFKVLALTRGLDLPLEGFRFIDQRTRL